MDYANYQTMYPRSLPYSRSYTDLYSVTLGVPHAVPPPYHLYHYAPRFPHHYPAHPFNQLYPQHPNHSVHSTVPAYRFIG